MRRIASLTMVALMTLVLVAPSFSRRRIEVWCTDKEVAGLEPVARQFRRDSRVEVDIVVQAEVRSRFMQAAIAKTGPDIVVGAHDWVGQLARNGVISEINLSARDRQKYFPVSIDGFTYNNRLYGVPYCVEAMVMFYNKKLIKEPPKTWEEVLTVAKGMTRDGNYGFLYGIDNNFYNNFPFIGSQGGYIFKWVDGRYDILDVGLATPGAVEANKFIYSFVQQGIVPASTNNGIVISAFKEGKVAMIMDGPWNTLDFVQSMGKDVVGVSKLPTLKGKASVPFVGARGFMINSATRYEAEARDFIIKYAGERDGQIAMFRAGGRPPAHIEAAGIASKEDVYIKTVLDSVNDGLAMPNVRAMSVVWNYAAGMVDRYKTGEQTVENAVKTAVDTIKEELSGNPSRFE